jgi:radical SAM protein with 4Fe4S-binding SPASM domain
VGGFSPAITLFGGEPLLHGDIIDVVRLIKDGGLRVNLITNGTLLARNARGLVEAGLDEIIFSLDGPSEIHDRVRNRRGVFRDAQRGFALLADEKARTHSRSPIVNVNSTIFDFNYESMGKTLETARSLGAEDVTFHHLIFIDQNTYLAHREVMEDAFGIADCDWRGFVVEHLPAIDPGVLVQKLGEVRRLGASVYPNLTDDEVIDYYTSFDFSPGSYSPSCMSPWMVAYIFPDGTMGPCLSNGVVMGNIREERFTTIWNNDRYIRYRREVKRRGHFPACIRCTELYRF